MKVVIPDNPEIYGSLLNRLVKDADGAQLREYLKCFEDASVVSGKRLRIPLSHNEHAAARAIHDSSNMAVDVMNAVWAAIHQDSK